MEDLINKERSESKEEKQRRRRERDLNDIKKVMSIPEGRRFVWRVMSETRAFHDPYVPGDTGYGTTRNVGRSSLGLWLLGELVKAEPEAFIKMQNEHASEVGREEKEKELTEKGKDILETNI